MGSSADEGQKMIQIIECEQGSDEWRRARMGKPTASCFDLVMAKPRDADHGGVRRAYMLKLAGEILSGEPMDNYNNAAMDRGRAMEAEAREFYSIASGNEVKQVGFIINGAMGCSPDSIIKKTGMLEIKTALRHIVIDKLDRNEFPPEHKAQCQGALMVAERDWIDIAIYPIIEADMRRAPNIPMFVKRARRDEPYITKMRDAVNCFNDELMAMVERIRNGQQREAA